MREVIRKSTLAAILALCTVLVVATVGSARAAEHRLGPLAVETWSTDVTPLPPEVHVLLRNLSDAPAEFMLEIPWSGRPDGRIRCDTPARTPIQHDVVDRLRRSRLAAAGRELGVVPARGWTHRSFVVGPEAGLVPCHVPFRLSLRDSKETMVGVVEVTKTNRHTSGEPNPESFELERIVETNRFTHPPDAILRILARNKSSKAASIGIEQIFFQCDEGSPPTQDMRRSTLRGEDTGPMSIEPGAAGVFVIGLNVVAGTQLEKCRGVATVVSQTGQWLLKRFEFSLAPTGYYDSGAHGFRDAGGSR